MRFKIQILTYLLSIYICLINSSCDSNIKSDIKKTADPSASMQKPILDSINLTDTIFLDFIYKQSKHQFEKTTNQLNKSGDIYECNMSDYCFSFYLDPKKGPIKAGIVPYFDLESNQLVKIGLNLVPDQKVSEKYLKNQVDFDYYFSNGEVQTLLNLYNNKYGIPQISNFQQQYKNFGIIVREGLKDTPRGKFLETKDEIKIIEKVTRYEWENSNLAITIFLSKYSYDNATNPYSNMVKQIGISYDSKKEIELRNQELKLKEEANQKIIEERMIEKNKMKDKI